MGNAREIPHIECKHVGSKGLKTLSYTCKTPNVKLGAGSAHVLTSTKSMTGGKSSAVRWAGRSGAEGFIRSWNPLSPFYSVVTCYTQELCLARRVPMNGMPETGRREQLVISNYKEMVINYRGGYKMEKLRV